MTNQYLKRFNIRNSIHLPLSVWKALAFFWGAILLLATGLLISRVINNPVSSQYSQSYARFIDTDLLAILPKYQETLLKETLEIIDKQRNRQLLLLVSFPQKSQGVGLSDSGIDRQTVLTHLIEKLNDSELFILPKVKERVNQSIELSKLLWPYRQQLMSKEDRRLVQQKNDDAFVEQAMIHLYGFSSPNETLFRDDPLFLFQRYLQSIVPSEAKNFTLKGSWLNKKEQKRSYYLLPLTLKKSAFDSDYQQRVKQVLTTLHKIVDSKQGQFKATGAIIFAEQGFSQSKREMSTVGLGGLIGIVLLLLFVFRSLTPLLSLLIALGLSLSLALNVALWFFGSLHVFTLLFSAAIVGISADYGFHFFTDLYTHENKIACNKKAHTDSVKRIFSGLTLGMISSVFAYALFAGGGFSVLTQVAVLALIGLPSMYLTVILLFPFVPVARNLRPLPLFFQRIAYFLVFNPLIMKIKLFTRRSWAVPVLMLIMIFLVSLMPSNDDVRSLQGLSKQTLAEEKHLRTLFNRPYISDHTVLIGKNLNELLAMEEHLMQRLPNLFYSDRSISRLLPSSQMQKTNYQGYQYLYKSSTVKHYLEELGGKANLNVRDYQLLDAVSLAELPALKQRFSEQLIELSSGEWVLLMPTKMRPKAAQSINAITSSLSGTVRVYHINRTRDMSIQFGHFRQQLNDWLLTAVGLLVVLGIAKYGYRGASIVLLPMLTALAALVIATILGSAINLFSMLAVLLLFGMGLDYVIFLSESQHPEKTMLSLCLSCVTTILSFGLLAISQTAALANFGLTVAVGMILILLFSPVVVGGNNEKTTI